MNQHLNASSRAFFIGCLLLTGLFKATYSVAETPIPKPTPKIIGGGFAEKDAWPFMAALVFKGVPSLFGQFCGASLIQDNWAMTAAHCVVDQEPEDIEVLIGRNQLSQDGGELIAVTEIIAHDDYNFFTLDSDIALLKLAKASTFEPILTLGRFSIQDKKVGALTTILGWGDTSINSRFFPDYLHQVELPIVASDDCNEAAGGVTKNMLCIGKPESGKDSCKGDSGGPAFLRDPENGTLRQVGIVSFGFGCASTKFVGVYTRVSEFTQFITSNICSAEQTPAAPELNITIEGQLVTARWNAVAQADGYRLNYAPYPDFTPIESIDVNQQTSFSVVLAPGSAFYVAINAYHDNCRSDYSTIEHFTVP